MSFDSCETRTGGTGDSVCGIVVIGRNEGERLRRCLDSVRNSARRVVYVDSGSTDGSVELAQSKGVDAVRLDMRTPFTAARARNAGFRQLQEAAPDVQYVQFVDGDCEVIDGWLEAATSFLEQHADVACVCGRLRERHPERSVYNLLCDMEWQAPSGASRSTGGNAMMRCVALNAAGGYREDMIAGEEPELCIRLRQAGWKIWRLPDEMALHDAAMTHFGQWWKRTRRGGHAAAEGAALHGDAAEWHNTARVRRSLLWGALLPITIVCLSVVHPSFSLLWLAYPSQVVRLAFRDGMNRRDVWLRSAFWMLGRFPEALGAMTFWLNRMWRRRAKLMEYK